MNYKLSVVIPMFNVEKYLKRCLDSIKGQAYKNLEVILIDDGSTDNTYKIARMYAKDNSWVCIQVQNGGQAKARNIGVQKATGDYIWFVDSDDYIFDNAVYGLMEKINKFKPDVLVFDILEKNSKSYKRHNYGTTLDTAGTNPFNKLIKRSLVLKVSFPINYWYEDLGTIPIMVGIAQNILKENKVYYVYDKTRKDSQTHLMIASKITDTIPMCERVLKTLKKTKHYDNKTAEEVQNLFFEHLVINTILLKFVGITNKKDRNTVVNLVLKTMNYYFPKWSFYSYRKHESKIKTIVKKSAILFYLHKYYLLGDLIWILPRKVLSILKITG